MAALEQVMQLKQQGLPESQIIQSLREQGISPREINEALSQSKIKTEVAPEQEIPLNTPIVETEYPRPETAPTPSNGIPEQMQPSIMPSESQTTQQPPLPAPQPNYSEQETYPQEQAYAQQYPSEYQDYQQPYDYQQSFDVETVNEIAEQIVEEKTTELKKQISSINKLKQELSPEIQRINKRLEKVENTLNELQLAILKKIGEYGQDIKNISEELDATQDSFSKMINPVLDHKREKEHKPKEHKSETKTHRRKKSAPDFESYLR